MIEIRIPEMNEWDSFQRLATREGWTIPQWELALYRNVWPNSAAVLRNDRGSCGFVTAVAFGSHGWIGNLIVDQDFRGRGFGRQLFAHALDCLERKGCTSTWLTASRQGRPLYEQFGFRVVDQVERWVLAGDGTTRSGDCSPQGDIEDVVAADAAVWDARRSELFSALAQDAAVFSAGDTVALLQAAEEKRVLGPWLSPSMCPRENRTVMAQVLGREGRRADVVADVLASSPVRALFRAAGFAPTGKCDLMVRGKTDGVDMASLAAFASLGSLG